MALALWTSQAATELEDILFYIRVEGGRPLTSQRIGEEFLDIAGKIAEGRLTGHAHSLAPPEWRYYRFKRWLIFYQPHSQGIEVMRIVDGAKDLPQEFA
jgi:plasmid stabilization system protein ParE